jgi:hypothetical protein
MAACSVATVAIRTWSDGPGCAVLADSTAAAGILQASRAAGSYGSFGGPAYREALNASSDVILAANACMADAPNPLPTGEGANPYAFARFLAIQPSTRRTPSSTTSDCMPFWAAMV